MEHPKPSGWKRAYSLFMLLALIIPILAACGGEATPEEGAGTQSTTGQATAATTTGAGGDKVLRIHQPVYPDVFDPQKSSFSNEIAILSLNYEGLTKLDENLETVPAAAEEWSYNDDATELTFTLREGLTYSDGSPLTAENFRYAAERTCDPVTAGEYQSILFDIAGCQEWAETDPGDQAAYDAAKAALGVEAPDDQTLIVRLSHPAPYFHTVASLWVFYPAKAELIEEGGETWWQNPELQIGNGPFQITGVNEQQLVTFTANENYWDGRPNLDGIEFIYQPDSAVALEAYNAGQLDIMQPDPSQLPTLRDGDLSDQLMEYPSATSYNLTFNLNREPFQDKKVREAFSYAFDRETYCEQIRNGDCSATLSWIPEGIPGAIETDKYGFNADAARQALAESSYGGPENLPEIKLTYNGDDPAAQPRVEWLAGQFRDILGVTVTLDPVEGTTLVELRKSNETHPQMLAFGGWIQDYPDPQNWLSVYWKCDATFAQRFGYCNPEFDNLVNQADQELDADRRMELYQQAGEILVEDVPGPFAYNLLNTFLVNPRVTGIATTPSDSEWPGQWASPLDVDIQQ